MVKFEGIFVPHVTPFDEKEEVNEEVLRELVNYFIDSGLHGLVTLGSNGELPNLNFEEKLRVLKIVVDEANGRIPVISGAGESATKEVIRFAKKAIDIGVNGFLIVSPYYFKPNEQEQFRYYSRIAESIDAPIFLYSVPKFTGYHLSLNVVEKLVNEYSNIVGIKDSGALISRIIELVRRVGDKISVFGGTGDMIYPTLAFGGHGATVAIANVAPSKCAEVYNLFKEKKFKEAKELQIKLNYLNEVIVKKYNQLSAIKTAMNLQGLKVGAPRHPTAPLGKKEIEHIKLVLKELGLLEP